MRESGEGQPFQELLARWRSAESKVYPTVLFDSHGYEIQLRFIRELSERLGDASSEEELMVAYAGRFDLYDRTSRSLSITIPHERRDTLIDAAFSARHRQLVEERERATAVQRIREANGPGWITLAETDTQPPMPGFRRLEMRLPDGLGLYCSIESDPETYRPLFTCEFLQLDPATGELTGDGDIPLQRHVYDDLAAWEAAISRSRADPPTGR